jgi:hypothetical protein
MPLSTATPGKLPNISDLRRVTQSIAMLDAIISPDWEYRYYSYNAKWAEGEEMASMRDGCGDSWFILFDRNGAALKGFAHECSFAKDISFAARIQKAVPSTFSSFLKEPAFDMNRVTFCFWRDKSSSAWHVVTPENGIVSPNDDGSAELIGILDGNPSTYHVWAEAYYERAVSFSVVQAIYRHQSLAESLVAELNPELSLSEAAVNAVEIGYPHESNG